MENPYRVERYGFGTLCKIVAAGELAYDNVPYEEARQLADALNNAFHIGKQRGEESAKKEVPTQDVAPSQDTVEPQKKRFWSRNT